MRLGLRQVGTQITDAFFTRAVQRLVELRFGFIARRLGGTQLGHQFRAIELDHHLLGFHVVTTLNQAFNHPSLGLGGHDHLWRVHFPLQ
ncbi:hypothetical protein D3C78_1349200 [compost metagenome]